MQELLVTTPVIIALVVLVSAVAGKYDALERPYLWASFAAHQVSAVTMIVLTRDFYEGGDMIGYWMFGVFHAARLRDDFFEHAPALLDVLVRGDAPVLGAMAGSSTGSMQAASAFLMFLFNDSLYAVCAAIAGGALLAKLAIYDLARRELPGVSKRRLLLACLLIPSAVFWSSGLLKEPLAMLGLGLVLRGAQLLTAAQRRLRGVLWAGVGGVFVLLLKPYLLPPLGLGGGLWYAMRALERRGSTQLFRRTRGLVIASVLVFAVISVTGSIAPYLSPENLAEEAMKMQAVGARIEGGSSYSLGSASATSLPGQLALVPAAIGTALFRPAIFEATNPLIFFNSLEMLIITLLMLSVLFRRGIINTLQMLVAQPALLFCAVFVLTLAIGVGLTTTNLGTLSRYRMPLMPFFGVLLVALLVRQERRAARPPPLRAPRVSRGTMP